MKNMLQKFTSILICFLLFSTTEVFSQETGSTLRGTITDDKGAFIPNVTITVKHEPTGFTTSRQTNSKGSYVIPDLKPGGPYTITIKSVGYKDEVLKEQYLSLGNNPDVSVAMHSTSAQLSEVVVSGSGKRNTASGLTVGTKQLNTLPTLGRSITDFTRLTPQSNNNSFGGTNFRYNNLTVDGSVNNDAIGFSNSFGGVSGGGQSGAAGAGTRTNPYSIDVIQEVQVQLAPFDVKLGNFTGGSVNAVTKSGTNDFHGSVYAYTRSLFNNALMGKSVDGKKTSISSDFYDHQSGATIGGPIVKNKAFFIVNFEQTRRQEPTFYNVGDAGAAITLAEATSIDNKLKNLGYDVGSYKGAYKIFTNSDKIFARLDFNLNKKSTLMLRAIYTNGWGNNLERSSTNFQFGSTDFTQHTNNLNLVAELKTKISNNLSNQFNIGYVNVHEYRDFPGALAPFMDIDNGRIWAGTWREASIYNMKQQTIEISDNVTLTKGNHKFTFGTHNEFYNLTYGFINAWNGRWEYSRGLNSFLADNPSRVRGAFSTNTGKLANDREAIYNNPPNPFTVALMSVYGQDEISLSKKLRITPGLRIDYSTVGNQPGIDSSLNGTVANTFANPTYSNTAFSQIQNSYLGKVNFSPRLGFNFDVKGNGSFVIRGGTGIFIGRVPFAWMGYGYTLNGSTYGNIDWNGIASGKTVPLAINSYGLKDTVSKYSALYAAGNKANTREVDVVDNNFKLPSVWRTNIAFDYKFGKGYKFTFDFLYTKTLNDVKFQQINLFDSAQYFTTGPTQSPIYTGKGKYNSAYSNVYFLSNTHEGYRYNITAQISKTTTNIKVGNHHLNLNWSLAYTYGKSKDMSNGIRNSWESNYNLNPSITPNTPQLSNSNFDLRHRIVGSIATGFVWNERHTTSIAFVYAGQSGNPYSLIYQSAPGTGGSNAPLPYIPKNQGDINLADVKDGSGNVVYSAAQQWTDLSNFIDGDKYLSTRKGQYAERNGLTTPWNHQLDMKIMHEFKLSKTNKFRTLQISLDVFNVLNLLNNDWGHVNFVTNVNNYTVNFLKYTTDANGKGVGTPASGYTPTYNFIKPNGIGGQYYTLDPINSRWQGQLGVKLNF
jgi:hypothetical protein